MNIETKKPEPIKHTMTIEVAIDPDWIDFLTIYNDIFGRNYCGYWLRGVEHDAERGWLCWEDDEEHRHGDEPLLNEAIEAWQHGEELPPGWFRLDRAMAIRAWEEGVKKWGTDWYEDGDSIRYDVVVQLSLLSEVRYG